MNANITINVDPSNPGQFFACCGLLEIAYRLTGHAEGWFEDYVFKVSSNTDLQLVDCIRIFHEGFESSMTQKERCDLKRLLNKKKSKLTNEEKVYKYKLKLLWDQEWIMIRAIPDLIINWWNDRLSGGSTLKTWAGKQLVYDILSGLCDNSEQLFSYNDSDILSQVIPGGTLPFYFSSIIGSHSSSLDVGFSLDALSKNSSTKKAIVIAPITELLAFVGLQRFRPVNRESFFHYTIWKSPTSVLIASSHQSRPNYLIESTHAFKLLYRSDYLKAFLTAQLQQY